MIVRRALLPGRAEFSLQASERRRFSVELVRRSYLACEFWRLNLRAQKNSSWSGDQCVIADEAMFPEGSGWHCSIIMVTAVGVGDILGGGAAYYLRALIARPSALC